MKVVTGSTMQLLDQRTINEYGIPGLTLMENAGGRCADIIASEFSAPPFTRELLVVAGKGNNGGDGFVLARLLAERGWDTAVIVLAKREEIAGDARVNLDRLPSDKVSFVSDGKALRDHLASLSDGILLVDAIFGTGLRNMVNGIYAEAVDLLNSANRIVVAIDIPSGIDAATGSLLGRAVRANITITFAVAKLGHVLYPGVEHVGRLHLVDIGIPNEVVSDAEGYEYLDAESVRPLLRKRERITHKGECGHLLLVAGSRGKTGAAAMAANSAVRSGAGLVTLAIPESLNAVFEVKTTEAMTLPLPDQDDCGYLDIDASQLIAKALVGKNVIALGPGVGQNPGTIALIRELVDTVELPMVIDADGLNALAANSAVLSKVRTATLVLTPHPGEMSRLAGLSTNDIEADRIGVARAFACKYQVYLVLKGARTVIASPDGRIAINGSGNPGMASGGMGDVLTGILAALIAQGYGPEQACRIGVFLHGYAADMVAVEKGEIGMSAVDVQEKIPYAFKTLMT